MCYDTTTMHHIGPIVGNEKLTGSQISLSVVDVKLAKNHYAFSDKCNRGGNMVFLIML